MLWLLPNTVGDQATGIELIGVTTTASGYDAKDLIAGSRSVHWRSGANTLEMAIGYQLAADLVATHVVVARADWMVTLGGAVLRMVQRNSGGAWSYLSGVSINPLTAANLTGFKNQDFVSTISPTVYRGYGVDFDSLSATAEAFQMSKMFFSVGFNFGKNPDYSKAIQWDVTPKNQSVILFTPQRGYFPYEVEATSQLTWTGLRRSQVDAFIALPQILNWPLYLYDDAADLIPWKLEHVLVSNWVEELTAPDTWDLTVSFQRLAFYE